MTKVSINIVVSNEKTKTNASQEFNLTKALKDEQLSPAGNKALRAAAAALGVKIPKPDIF